mgnify:CR=1 FL=1
MTLTIYIIGCAISALVYVIITAVILAKSGETTDKVADFIIEHLGVLVGIGLIAAVLSWIAIFLYFLGFIGVYMYNRVKRKIDATITESSN